ncbi:MAG: tetrathionate reductase family octaheme c-type cytochrome [Chloroflexota bacterium]
MKNRKNLWIIGLLGILLVIVTPLAVFWPRTAQAADDPWAFVPQHPIHTDHSNIVQGPGEEGQFETPQQVTKACLECHEDSADEVMHTTHWTWESQPFDVPWRDEPVTIGKANQINNFCISAQGNQKSCTSCHVGYGWQETEPYNFTASENVDCLVCHAQAGYFKGSYGNPGEGVDLLAAARSVASPTRENCGNCHFDGGGGNGVKHGDLDETLKYPTEQLDIHMGGLDFICTDCHTTEAHAVKGRLVADNYQIAPAEQVACTDCHIETPHDDERINIHTASVACQTCHIPEFAIKDPTKMTWDWSTAGQDIGDDHYTYLKIKGDFVYEKDVIPTYTWFNGNLDYRYLLGDKIDPSQPTMINLPSGSIEDANAKIFPFKVHVAKQPYDVLNNYLLAPITSGTDGYWTNFDWDQAFQLAVPITGLQYSGQYGFAETWMYWPITHMVQPKENALQCDACHSDNGRFDWQALGYPGDPIEWGGRFDNK